jgi:hypothetical protein
VTTLILKSKKRLLLITPEVTSLPNYPASLTSVTSFPQTGKVKKFCMLQGDVKKIFGSGEGERNNPHFDPPVPVLKILHPSQNYFTLCFHN